jgi:protein arginine kinase
MIPDYLIEESPFWLKEEGLYAEIVLSSRVRIARNLADTPFVHRADASTLKDALERIKESGLNIDAIKSFIYMESLSPVEKQFLRERRIVSQDMAEHSEYSGGGITTD